MADYYDEINLLVNDIIERKVSKEVVAKRIDDLKREYGDDIFPSISFKKEPKPWNKKYLAKLKEMNITGACSEEFLLHMAEVSDEIASQNKRLVVCTGISVIAVLIVIIVLVIGKAR